MEGFDEFEGEEEVDYDFNLDEDFLNEGEPHSSRFHPSTFPIWNLDRLILRQNHIRGVAGRTYAHESLPWGKTQPCSLSVAVRFVHGSIQVKH